MKARTTAALLVFVAGLAVFCMAARVTVDPNKGGSHSAARSESDPRLAQLVTYEGGYKRLHYAIEEISAKTGVTIRCGANNQDWQVRDMPLVFAATEMPLGKLLEAIASAANLELIAETIKSDSGRTEKQYRLSLTSRARIALENALEDKYRASVEREGRMWDALVATADLPDAAFGPLNGFANSARVLGKILKELGPEVKAKTLAGQKTDLTTSSFSIPELLREFVRASSAQFASAFPNRTLEGEVDVDTCSLSISPNNDPATGNFSINTVAPISIRSNLGSNGTAATQVTSMVFARSLPLEMAASQLWRAVKGREKPAILESPAKENSITDRIAKDLLPLDIKSDAEPAPAFMRQKIALDLPAGKDVTYAEAISAVAKAAGLDIVAEDYIDHRTRPRIQMRTGTGTAQGTVTYSTSTPLTMSSGSAPPGNIAQLLAKARSEAQPPFSPLSGLGKDATVGDALRALTKSQLGAPQFEWFYNEKARLLIARPPDWIKKHSNLMPESLLVDLGKKANGNGIEIDDFCKLTAYSAGQIGDWVQGTKDLDFLGFMMCSAESRAVWALYERLTAEEKAAARSDAGLPLAKFDTAWVSDFLKAGVESDRTIRMFGGPGNHSQTQQENAARQKAVLTDPAALRALTLKVTREPASLHVLNSSTMLSHPGVVAGSGQWHTYRPELKGEYKDEPVMLTFDALFPSFPIYSPERQAELDRAAPSK